LFHYRTKVVLETLNSSKVSRIAKVDPERCQSYFVPVIVAFDSNNIFIPIDDKLKKSKKFTLKNIQKIPIIVVTLFTVVGGIQIILDHHKKRNF